MSKRGRVSQAAQKVLGILDRARTPQGTGVQRGAHGAGAEAVPLLGQLHGSFDQATVQLVGDQPIPKGHQGPFAKGQLLAVQAVAHELPAAIPERRFDDLIVGDARLCLQDGR